MARITFAQLRAGIVPTAQDVIIPSMLRFTRLAVCTHKEYTREDGTVVKAGRFYKLIGEVKSGSEELVYDGLRLRRTEESCSINLFGTERVGSAIFNEIHDWVSKKMADAESLSVIASELAEAAKAAGATLEQKKAAKEAKANAEAALAAIPVNAAGTAANAVVSVELPKDMQMLVEGYNSTEAIVGFQRGNSWISEITVTVLGTPEIRDSKGRIIQERTGWNPKKQLMSMAAHGLIPKDSIQGQSSLDSDARTKQSPLTEDQLAEIKLLKESVGDNLTAQDILKQLNLDKSYLLEVVGLLSSN